MSPSSWYKEFMAGYGVDVSSGYKPGPKPKPGPPMDLDNMRQNGVRSLLVACRSYHHAAAVNMDDRPGHLTVPSFANRMRCGKCGGRNVDVRPNWIEKPLWKPEP